ncbi:hypothetical protein BH18ACT1_BH18ACT1_10930 [soil metagenome]
MYGRGSEARSLSVARRDLRAALTTESGANALLDLQVDGEVLLTLVKDMQRDPVRNEVTHVDFIVVSRDEVVSVDVHVVLECEAAEVGREGGTVEQQLFDLTVSAKPGDIPTSLPLDVSGLTIGDSLRVSDLVLPSGVTTDVDPEETIVIATVSQAAAEAEALDIEAAAALEAEEGEAGEVAPDEAAGETTGDEGGDDSGDTASS